jgi:hypothetical protein
MLALLATAASAASPAIVSSPRSGVSMTLTSAGSTAPATTTSAPQAIPGTVLFTTFNSDPNNLYDASVSWTLVGIPAHAGLTHAYAVPLTPVTSTHVRQVRMGLNSFTGHGLVQVGLHKDVGGIPGPLLRSAQATITNLPDGCCATVDLNSRLPVRGGMTYWLSIVPVDADFDGWNLNNTGQAGTFAFDDGTGWVPFSNTYPAFEVVGD